jgi:cation diffusion facilitator CzcD-associated flavoprotein CzcO
MSGSSAQRGRQMPSNSPAKNATAIVIGAGASGLAAAHALRERNIQVRIIDRAYRAGEAWYHRHPQLRLNTHRHLSGLPGLAIPRAAGAFPSRNSIIRYLDEYAAQLDVPIDYGVKLTDISKAPLGWAVETSAGVYRARHVVVATGYASKPVIPNWKGRETFSKQLVHAADFGDIEQYRNRKILVVGAGNSGTDILNHFSTIQTDRIWVSVRHGPVIFPTRLCGIPMQRLSPLFAMMPVPVADAMLALTGYLVYCFALMGAYRARQFVSGKAPFAGNSGALAKIGNAAGRDLASSQRARRQEAVRGVAFPRNRPTMASKMRRAVNLLVTR